MAKAKVEVEPVIDTVSKRPQARSAKKPIEDQQPPTPKRSYMRQTDVPMTSLEDALRLPQCIFDNYAGKPTTPFNVAKALNIDPKGSQLRVLSGAAIAFGLIEGGAQATSINVTDLSRKIIRPKEENEDIIAKRAAILKPKIFNEFLRHYDGNQFPRQDLALNVLEDMGVPQKKAEEVLERISESARQVGFITEIKSKYYVQLTALDNRDPKEEDHETNHENEPQAFELRGAPTEGAARQDTPGRVLLPPPFTQTRGTAMVTAAADDLRRRRVFITHGKDRALVDPIKKLLEYGEMEPIVSVERQSVSKPVPEKVLDDMRNCGAAIIHVDADRVITDAEGTENVILNPNVLIEIGAAMAFYGRRFILLVKNGVKLPSNLQGLYEVRYDGDILDATATIKLLEAMKDTKNYSLPTDIEGD